MPEDPPRRFIGFGDFARLAHKNIVLKPGDSIQVEQKGAVVDRWKASEDKVRELMK